MRYSGAYAIASRDIVFESFDGDSVVLDLATGKYFGFSDTGSVVWEALSQQVPPAALVGAAPAATAFEIESFVARLMGFDLLAQAPAMAARPLSPELAARLAAVSGPITVDAYDDLADLVVVDPIHDVDEPVGWPAVKKAS